MRARHREVRERRVASGANGGGRDARGARAERAVRDAFRRRNAGDNAGGVRKVYTGEAASAS